MFIKQTGRRCGSLAADSRHLESNTKSIGRPVTQISPFEIFKMADFFHDVITSLVVLVTGTCEKVLVAKTKSFSAVIDTLWHLYSDCLD